MANLQGFDASKVEPSTFEVLPNGEYNAIIVDSSWKQTQAGTGRYLEMKLQVCEGEYKGRTLFARLNLDNPNAKAVEIARSQLSAICRAVGVLTPQDSCELHNLPLSIKVACKRNEANDTITNEIKGFGMKLSASRVATARVTTATDDVAPWKKQG